MNENRLNENILAGYDKTRHIQDKQYICFAPFKNIYFNTQGNPAACWQTFFYDKQSSYPQKSLRDIWFGKDFQNLRKNIINYDLAALCKECHKHLSEKNYVNILAKAYDTDYPLTAYPSILELELSNTCNLECIMCYGTLSCNIRKHRDKLPPLENPYGPSFVEELKEFIPYLKEVRFNGGEPLLIDIYYQIWELILALNPSIKIIIATNGTILNQRFKEILKKGNFHINFSIDSLHKETYEAIRVNARFEKTIENLQFYHSFCKENNRTLCLVVNPLRNNWREMPQLIEYANELDVPLWFNTITHPETLSLWALPASKLQEIYNTLSEHQFQKPEAQEYQKQHNLKIYKNLVEVQIKNWLTETQEREKQQ
jgi:molybdenum cofactor biosynthesis enzyme MoaA